MQAEDYGVFRDLLVTVPVVSRSTLQEQYLSRRVISLILALRWSFNSITSMIQTRLV